MTGKFQIIQKFKKRERVSRASEPQVIIAETIPVPDRYQTGIYNSKRKRFQRVKSVSSPNLLETALCNDERYFSENKKRVLIQFCVLIRNFWSNRVSSFTILIHFSFQRCIFWYTFGQEISLHPPFKTDFWAKSVPKYASLEAEVDQSCKTRYPIGSKVSNQDTELDQKVYRFLPYRILLYRFLFIQVVAYK